MFRTQGSVEDIQAVECSLRYLASSNIISYRIWHYSNIRW